MALLSKDLGIDLGTCNTLVYAKGKGIIIREPSVVATDVRTVPAKVVAVGTQAKDMIGRTPGSVTAAKPLKNGVIADYEMTADMLRALITRAMGHSPLARSRVMLCIPSGVTEVERRAVHDAARNAGARYVSLIEAPMAAAIGAGLPVSQPVGSMIADLGGGTCEVAVLSLGDVVASASIRVGGDDVDDAIIAYIRRRHNLLIGSRTAEDIKIRIGSAARYEGEAALSVRGRNLSDGLPKNVEITSAEVREAIAEPLNRIVDMICDALEKTPPELASDIFDRGITLTGGLAKLRGIDKMISRVTKTPVRIAKDPGDCVIRGTGFCLEKNAVDL